jgi:hypothetical protein
MSNPSLYFVKIENGTVERWRTDAPPASESESHPRVTTIHVFNWDSKQHRLRLVWDPKTEPGHDEQYIICPP